MSAAAPERRHCVIGAGYCGLGVAKAFADAGIPYDQLEATGGVGGNWAHGVYDSTHLISSRDSTHFSDYEMPRSYPDFPSREQVLAYLEDYAEHFGLRRRIEFDTGVERCEPLNADGTAGWRVELASGEVRHYAGVVACNGHDWDKRIPAYPGTFSGKTIHSRDYRRPADLDGPRVLVVGAGNSACDVAIDAASAFGAAEVSMRDTHWFVPKTLLGIPLAELDRWWFPTWMQKPLLRATVRLAVGPYRRYGLEPPRHPLFSKAPTVNSELFSALRHGRVRPRRGIERLDGHTVHFTDGSSGSYDTIVWATGYRISLPFVDRDLFDWKGERPVRVATMIPPRYAGFYAFGFLQPRSGCGPLITAGSRALARIVLAQQRLPHPIVNDLARFERPRAQVFAGSGQMMRKIAAARAGLPLIMAGNRLLGRTVTGPGPLPAVPAQPTPEPAGARDCEQTKVAA